MATAATGWGAVCIASITAQTETTATITVTSYWQNLSWDYNINNVSSTVYCSGDSYKVLNAGSVNSTGVGTSGKVSLGSHSFTVNKTTAEQSINCYSQIVAASSYVSGTKNSAKVTVTVPAKTSYTVTYNANGGSGAPSAQTKWHGTALTLSTTKPTRTGYTFAGWATSTSGSVAYTAGASYTANANVTLYAKWTAITYTVSYNANGGSGAPSNQTKTHDVVLTLSSTKPTRTNYSFKGWGTSASSTTVAYTAGAKYSTNAAVTLYAIWELDYVKPIITGFSVSRCTSNGTMSDEGTYALVKLDWSTDKTVSSIVIKWKLATTSSYGSSTAVSASGTSGSVSQVVGVGALSTENTYDIQVTVADSGGSTSATTTLQGTAFPIDFKHDSNGVGVAFGKPAETTNLFEVAMPAQFNQDVYGTVFGLGGATEIPENADFNNYKRVGSYAVKMNATASTIRNIPNETAGRLIVFSGTGQDIVDVNESNYAYLVQVYTTYHDSHIYIRTLIQGGTPETWEITPWREIARMNDVLSNSVLNRVLCGGEWLGFYPNNESAINNTGRKGWIGHDGSNNLQIFNEVAGGSVVVYNSALQFWFAQDRFRVLTDNAAYMGDTSHRWIALYAVHGSIQTSDGNQKENIVRIGDKYESLFERLIPITYKFKGERHDRTHVGFIAQDVKEAMEAVGLSNEEFGAYCKDIKTEYDEEKGEDVAVLDENGKPIELYSLRYTEFIALNTHMIQKQQAEIETLKNENETLKSEIETLKNEFAELKELIKGTLS